MEIVEPILGITVARYELSPDEIAAGEFTIPAVDAGDAYMAHMADYDKKNAFPEELELHVTVRYDSADGEKTLEYTVKDTAEQGWGIMYWADSEPATEWSFPGYFRFSTYESLTPVSLVVDDPSQVTTGPDKTVLSVSLSIGGREILPEECEIREEEENDPLAELMGDPNPQKYYYARLFLKRPDWADEHGTIHLKVTQQLSDGTLWTTEQDTDY